MKTIIRKNGQKVVVTNALYEAIRKNGLLEDESLENLNDGQVTTDAIEKSTTNSTADSKNSSKLKELPKEKLKKKIDKPFIMNLEFDEYGRYSNEIKKSLAALVSVYRKYVDNGFWNEPYCQVFRSEKFQKQVFNKWKRIAKILEKKSANGTLSDNEEKFLLSVNLKKSARQSMQEDVLKVYNMQ